jgi:hypothetical protein
VCLLPPLLQARSYDEATSSVLGFYLRNAQTRALSHPLPVMRAREIDRWSQSVQYKALLARNQPPPGPPTPPAGAKGGMGAPAPRGAAAAAAAAGSSGAWP